MNKDRLIDSSAMEKLPQPHDVYVKIRVDSTELDAAIEKTERLLNNLAKAAEIMALSATEVEPGESR